jgi:hypothetical protein
VGSGVSKGGVLREGEGAELPWGMGKETERNRSKGSEGGGRGMSRSGSATNGSHSNQVPALLRVF